MENEPTEQPPCPVCMVVIATHATCYALHRSQAENERLRKALADALGQWEWFEREGPYTGRQALWLKWMKRVDALLHQREEDE